MGEALTCLLYLIAAWNLWQARKASGQEFNGAKKFAVIAATMGFLIWYFGFMVVGGEWFAMWQSSIWNGQQKAFMFYMTMLAVLIIVIQPDGDLRID
jgi:predicted small integral membrane protein